MSEPSRPRRIARGAGLVGAVIGVAATGVAVGVAAERLLLRRRRPAVTADPFADERFGPLPYDECLTIATDDGLDLYVEIVERPDGIDLDFGPAGETEPTLIFIHGFCLDMGTFHFQRTALSRRGDYRMVFYDQPGHGRSGRLEHGEYTLESLGGALKRVIDETAPEGPLVLIGHSMGGMTIMALAELYPDLFGERIQGVVLSSTSAGKLDEVNLGMPDFLSRFSKPLMPVIIGGGKLTSGVVDSIRRASTDLAWLLTRRYGFGTDKPSPALVSYVELMNARTSTEVVTRYLRTIYTHARYPALEALKLVKALVICGEDDKLTPLEHSAEICRILPDAEFVAVPGAGHVALLERPDIVNAALLDFLEQID
ncbi:MAG: alpha/beta hydrolase [Actinobacteria bacterium 13_1_20CM_3_71_11]|nr:MAG: alpha/beta hydrolase [Actinobacteria bacterium 13_1_20CM_3_71_11]